MKTEDIKKDEENLTENEELDDGLDEKFVKETKEYFNSIWKELKDDVKVLSKRELARQMFVSGALMCRESFGQHMQELSKEMEKNPEKVKELLSQLQSNAADTENNLWEEGYFAETMGSADMKEKRRTFHMKHDEEMNHNCKKCNKKISAHNKDWHGGICDKCFDKEAYNKK